MSSFSEAIRSIRKDKGLSVREAAKRSGISHPYLSQLENGKRDIPTVQVIVKLSKGLDTDLSHLLEIAGYTEQVDVSLAVVEKMVNELKEYREAAPEKIDILELINFILTGTMITDENREYTRYESLLIATTLANISAIITDREVPLSDEQIENIESAIEDIKKRFDDESQKGR